MIKILLLQVARYSLVVARLFPEGTKFPNQNFKCRIFKYCFQDFLADDRRCITQINADVSILFISESRIKNSPPSMSLGLLGAGR